MNRGRRRERRGAEAERAARQREGRARAPLAQDGRRGALIEAIGSLRSAVRAWRGAVCRGSDPLSVARALCHG